MVVRESILRDIARILIWYPVRWLIGYLPVKTSFALFRTIANIHLVLNSASLHTLKRNINRSIPPLENPKDVLRTYLENHYIDRLHIFTYPRLKYRENLEKICTLEGIEHLDATLSEGGGAIVVLGHYGPIQLPLFQLGLSGYPVIQVGLPTDEGLSWIGRNVAFRLRLAYENMIPVTILPANEFLRPLFQHLKDNGVVMMNIDPAGGGRWLGRLTWKSFLGHPIPFPLGAALLSQKTGAPILPLSIQRAPKNRYLFRINPARKLQPTESSDHFVENLVQWYESSVISDPGLWHFWDEFQEGKLINESKRSKRLNTSE